MSRRVRKTAKIREYLDLHGVFHAEVVVMVEDFILNNLTYPKYIITGNSEKMKQIVFPVLDRYECKYLIKTSNPGEIVVTE
jgi:hypothetical protein